MEGLQGRHVRAAIAEQRASGSESRGVHTVLPPARYPAPDDREVYEQIGTLYERLFRLDHLTREERQGDEDGTGVQEFADLLDKVRHALLRPDGETAAVMLRALTRYEHDRTGT